MLSKVEVIFFTDRTHITHFSSGVPSVLGCLFVFTVRLSAFLTIRACVDGPISLILDRDVIRIFSEYFSDVPIWRKSDLSRIDHRWHMSQKIQRGTSGRTLKHQYLALRATPLSPAAICEALGRSRHPAYLPSLNTWPFLVESWFFFFFFFKSYSHSSSFEESAEDTTRPYILFEVIFQVKKFPFLRGRLIQCEYLSSRAENMLLLLWPLHNFAYDRVRLEGPYWNRRPTRFHVLCNPLRSS